MFLINYTDLVNYIIELDSNLDATAEEEEGYEYEDEEEENVQEEQ